MWIATNKSEKIDQQLGSFESWKVIGIYRFWIYRFAYNCKRTEKVSGSVKGNETEKNYSG